MTSRTLPPLIVVVVPAPKDRNHILVNFAEHIDGFLEEKVQYYITRVVVPTAFWSGSQRLVGKTPRSKIGECRPDVRYFIRAL
jgi:hypothetical protein